MIYYAQNVKKIIAIILCVNFIVVNRVGVVCSSAALAPPGLHDFPELETKQIKSGNTGHITTLQSKLKLLLINDNALEIDGFTMQILFDAHLFENAKKLAPFIIRDKLFRYADEIDWRGADMVCDMLAGLAQERDDYRDCIVERLLNFEFSSRWTRACVIMQFFIKAPELLPVEKEVEIMDFVFDVFNNPGRGRRESIGYYLKDFVKLKKHLLNRNHLDVVLNQYEVQAELADAIISSRSDLITKAMARRFFRQVTDRHDYTEQKNAYAVLRPVIREKPELMSKRRIRSSLEMVSRGSMCWRERLARVLAAKAISGKEDEARMIINGLFEGSKTGNQDTLEGVRNALCDIIESRPSIIIGEDIHEVLALEKRGPSHVRERTYMDLWVLLIDKRPDLIEKDVVDMFFDRVESTYWYDDRSKFCKLLSLLAERKKEFVRPEHPEKIVNLDSNYTFQDLSKALPNIAKAVPQAFTDKIMDVLLNYSHGDNSYSQRCRGRTLAELVIAGRDVSEKIFTWLDDRIAEFNKESYDNWRNADVPGGIVERLLEYKGAGDTEHIDLADKILAKIAALKPELFEKEPDLAKEQIIPITPQRITQAFKKLDDILTREAGIIYLDKVLREGGLIDVRKLFGSLVTNKNIGLGLDEEHFFKGICLIFYLANTRDAESQKQILKTIAQTKKEEKLHCFIDTFYYYFSNYMLEEFEEIVTGDKNVNIGEFLALLRKNMHKGLNISADLNNRIRDGWEGVSRLVSIAVSDPAVANDVADKIIVTMRYLRQGVGQDRGFGRPAQIENQLPNVQNNLIRLINLRAIDIATKRHLVKALCTGRGDIIETLRTQAVAMVQAATGLNDSRNGLVGRIRDRIHNRPSPQHLAAVKAYRDWVESDGRRGEDKLRHFDYTIGPGDYVDPARKAATLQACDTIIPTLEEVYGEGTLDNMQIINSEITAVLESDDNTAARMGQLFVQRSGENSLARLERIVGARELIAGIIRFANGERLFDALKLHNRLELLFYRVFSDINIHKRKFADKINLIGLLIKNTRLNGYKSDEITMIEKELNNLKSRDKKDKCLRIYSIIRRIERFLGSVTQDMLSRYQPVAENTAKAIDVRDEDYFWVENFSSNLFRSDTVYLLALLLKDIKKEIMKEGGISGWQSVVRGDMEGKLHYIEKIEEVDTVGEDEILIIKDLPSKSKPVINVAGIITCSEDSILSHPAIRARQHGIPFTVCPDETVFGELVEKYHGKRIRVNVAENNTKISEAGDVSQGLMKKKDAIRRKIELPETKKTTKTVYLPEEYSLDTVGNKALRLSKIKHGLKKSKNIALGFGLLDKVLDKKENNDIKDTISLLMHKLESAEEADIDEYLSQLRKQFLLLKISEKMMTHITNNIIKHIGNDPVFFRSSTNAEDLPGYPGAGLYSSLGSINPENPVEVEFAIKMIWASVWSETAYYDREANGIDHSQVKMAVLVQEMIPAEYSFVVHTRNPNNGSNNELIIELVQGLGETLVSGEYDGLPHLFMYNKKTGRIKRLSYANKDKKLLLDGSMIVERVADYTKDIFTSNSSIGLGLVRSIAKASMSIKKDFGSVDQDIEGCIIKSQGKYEFVFVQSRDQLEEKNTDGFSDSDVADITDPIKSIEQATIKISQ